MKYKKYNKLVNTTTTKKSLLTDIDNKLVVTRGQRGDHIRVGEWKAQAAECKMGSRMYLLYKTRSIGNICNNCKWKVKFKIKKLKINKQVSKPYHFALISFIITVLSPYN